MILTDSKIISISANLKASNSKTEKLETYASYIKTVTMNQQIPTQDL